ncbi:unnamed protein product [Taenia asiatica]|uniref:Uncharacterized protein n=1 Tax=Taenia asiatica TaxID=60517 RepID=A0A0R3WH92_TAEAS|nr:unnamed protein product [Taenia asiatica]
MSCRTKSVGFIPSFFDFTGPPSETVQWKQPCINPVENTVEVCDTGCNPVTHREVAAVHKPCLPMATLIKAKHVIHSASGWLQICHPEVS